MLHHLLDPREFASLRSPKAGVEPITSESAIHLAIRYLLSVLQFSIHRKDEHPFTELHIDISKEAENFGSRDLANLGALRRKAECA